ncbi:MAG: YggS family pyridoxal phosphate-dependent enzyme [Burkholderiaceae bacterium]
MTTIDDNLQAVRQRIAAACKAAGRDAAQVRLLAVAKTFAAASVRQALDAGQRDVGENYIQEAVAKMAELGAAAATWHCIGPIQGNKTRLVAEHFDWAQSVDRLRIAQRLSDQRPAHLPALQLCIQVNTDGGPTKAGVTPDALPELARAIMRLPRLQLRGLMTIPEPAPDFAAACALHARARQLFDSLNAQGMALDTLSMGMSADLEAAIHAGSTMVRVGTAIFGSRTGAAT